MYWYDNMKCFHKLTCDQLSIIQDETLRYLNEYTTLLSKNTDQFWNKIQTTDYLKECPSLTKYCDFLGLKIKEVAFTVVWSADHVPLHIDELPVIAKINFPILNTKGSINCWYDVPEELFKKYSPVNNSFDKKYYLFHDIDLKKCHLIDQTELDAPMVFNSQISHMVKMPKNPILPRVVMPVMFFDEPMNYLR